MNAEQYFWLSVCLLLIFLPPLIRWYGMYVNWVFKKRSPTTTVIISCTRDDIRPDRQYEPSAIKEKYFSD